MDPDRLTGFVYPVKKNGVPVRGRWQLWVNLPSEPAFDRDGQPVLDANGRQKQRYPKTTKVVEAKGKKAAERLLETWIAELEAHCAIDPDRLRLAELLDRWLEATRGEMRVASYNSYRRIRRIHVDPALGQVLAGKLTRAQLSTYYAAKMRGSKKKKPLAETAVAHHHAMLKTAYNWALEEELPLVNPALRVKNPPALRPKTRPVWSMEEIASTVIKARGLQVHAAGVLAGFSGLRVGEIAGLLWSDLDLERGFVTVCRTIEEDDDGSLLEYPPKNGKARVMPLPAAACDELRVWLAAQKEYRLAQGHGVERGRPRGPEEGRQPDGALDLEEPVVELGRPSEDRPAPADSRAARLLGTWVYETYGVKQAQEWLGHSDPATTLRHYVRLTTAARAKAVAGLDEVTRAALEAAEERAAGDAEPVVDNVVALASRRL
jgi:integrase